MHIHGVICLGKNIRIDMIYQRVKDGHASCDGNTNGIIVDRNIVRAECFIHFLDQSAIFFEVLPSQDNDKFIAADAEDRACLEGI